MGKTIWEKGKVRKGGKIMVWGYTYVSGRGGRVSKKVKEDEKRKRKEKRE